MRFILAFTLLFLSSIVWGQQTREVRGVVQDTAGVRLEGVNIRLVSPKDTLISATDREGRFAFSRVLGESFNLSLTLLGYQLQENSFKVDQGSAEPIELSIVLRPQRNLLKEVVVFAVPVVIRGDTIQYNSAAYQTPPGALLEELIRKMPGLEVSRSGQVKAQGSLVSRVKVNGKEFFGGDVVTATRNLPAEIVETVEVIDDYGLLSNFSGIKESPPEKILNITIKKDRNQGMFGQATMGIGTDYRYLTSLSVNSFDEDEQLSVLGSINNTNTSLFSFGDISGAGGRETVASDLGTMIELDDGINRTNSVGFNFRKNLSPAVSTYGGYVFTNRNNTTEGSTNITSIYQNNTITSQDLREQETRNNRHNLTWNFESGTSGPTYYKISPTLSYSSTRSNSITNSLITSRYLSTDRHVTSADKMDNPAGDIDIFVNHRFGKSGRQASFNLKGNLSGDDRLNDIDEYRVNVDSSWAQPTISYEQLSQYLINDQNSGNVNFRASYIEPINTSSFVEVNFEHYFSSNKNNRETSNIGNYESDELRRDTNFMNYAYQFQSDQIGFNYQYNDEQTSYTIGFGLQPTKISGYSWARDITTNRKFINLIPSGRFSFKINKFSSFSVNYRGRNNQPNFAQIQPVRDISNSQNIIIGNPELKSEFINNLSLQYRNFNLRSGNTFFTNLTVQHIQDKIVTNRVPVENTTQQETSFLNTSGYFDAQAYYLYSLSLIEQVFNINFSGSGNYSNNISFINFKKNSGRYLVYTQGAQLSYTEDDWLSLDFKSTFTLNQTRNTLASMTNNEAYTWLFAFGGRTYLGNWSLSFDISQRVNNGFSNFINENPTLLNVYLERTFLKNDRAAVRIQGYDLFNENTGLSHEVFGNDIYETRNSRLGRYFLISFNYRLQRFPGL
jgi:hypothetical protein